MIARLQNGVLATLLGLGLAGCADYDASNGLLGLLLQGAGNSASVASYQSCQEILNAGAGSVSGTYQIDPAGSGTLISVECDMTSAGGGWTGVTLNLARNQFNGNLVAVIAAASSGFDSSNRPFAQNPGTHTYHYSFDFAPGFSQFYLRNYVVRGNSTGSDTSELGGTAMSNWSVAYSGSAGDIGFGSASASGPVVSFVSIGATITGCTTCFHTWTQNGTVYNLGSTSTRFRMGWGEAGGQVEGWYPWYSGEIFLR